MDDPGAHRPGERRPVAVLPLIAALVGASWQGVVAGQAGWLAGSAARGGARAAVGSDPAAARAALPAGCARGLRIRVGEGESVARLPIPGVAGVGRLGTATARAGASRRDDATSAGRPASSWWRCCRSSSSARSSSRSCSPPGAAASWRDTRPRRAPRRCSGRGSGGRGARGAARLVAAPPERTVRGRSVRVALRPPASSRARRTICGRASGRRRSGGMTARFDVAVIGRAGDAAAVAADAACGLAAGSASRTALVVTTGPLPRRRRRPPERRGGAAARPAARAGARGAGGRADRVVRRW